VPAPTLTLTPALAPTLTPSPAPALTLTLRSLLSSGDEQDDEGDLSPRLRADPLRLALTSSIFPLAGGFPQCASREEAAGNTVNGFPIQRLRTLALTPRLSLIGFSQGGCPIDGGLGGGATYTIPLRPSLWLVAGAGYYVVPGRDVAIPTRTGADLRMDLVKKTDSGQLLRFGVEQKSGTNVPGRPVMVTFGMGF
jgi:hypothetical protein